MQKATPLVLILILAAMAGFLSLRPNKEPLPQAPPANEAPAVLPVPAVGEPVTTAKTDVAVESIEPRPWPQAQSDIAPDSEAIFGTLKNGLRYIIYPNQEPPKRVSLRLHIDVGSLMEADDQQGLAHFLEHMVFNGSKNYTAAELIPKMQRLGISFGAHANAYTSFDETVYMLDLPDLSKETLDLGFTVMRDFGDGALLAEEEIDKERGVILSEKMSRDSVGYRIMQQQFKEILPDSLLTRRFPIGDEDVIKSATRERFVDLYTRYYTPQRMTFIVVGDIDEKEVRDRIEASFGSMTNPANPGKDPEMGAVAQPEGLVTAVFSDKEVASTDVSLMMMRPYVAEPDTAEIRTRNMTLDIANSILTRRFERISKTEGSPVASGSASDSRLFNYMEMGSIDITAADDRWQEVVPILEQEFRRVLDFGFTDAELSEVKSNLLNAYEQQVRQKATRRSDGIATVLARSVNDNSVFSDPSTDLEIAKRALDSITPAACHAAFVEFWESSGNYLILTTKEKPENAERDLAVLFEESRGSAIEAPAARVSEPFGYTNFGKPGTVTSRKEVADFGITQLVLSNQVRVNLKPTSFEQGKIRLVARIGSGKLSQPKSAPMLDMFATAIFEGGGLGKHSNDDLQQILAGKNVSSSLSIGEDAFVISGATTAADFTTQLQLMCASITDPGYRNEALWQFQKATPMIYQQIKHTAAGPQQEMESWLYGYDPRFTLIPEEKLLKYTIDDVKKWLTPELTKGYLELSIVGDFEVEKVIPDLLSTFGSLQVRPALAPTMMDARKIVLPNAPAIKTFTYESKIPQGIATVIWKTAGVRGNQKEFRRLNLLGLIYADRLREEIREKLGASYSPNAGATGSDAFENLGYLIGQSVGKPEDVPLLLKTMLEQADELARTGATEDELDRALKPTLGQLEKTLRDNSYWLGTVMSQSQADPKRLDLARDRDADYRSIKLAEINALAKKYLGAENTLQVTIKPE